MPLPMDALLLSREFPLKDLRQSLNTAWSLLPKFLPGPAIAFYLIFIVGVVIFAVAPAIKSGEWSTALLYGALFGFFSYGVYDFTNMATLRNWTATITAADVAWGTVLTGTSATMGYLASRLAG